MKLSLCHVYMQLPVAQLSEHILKHDRMLLQFALDQCLCCTKHRLCVLVLLTASAQHAASGAC